MKASIIIRAYNAEDTIRRAVDSALSQEFSSSLFEVIAVDDGSTDKTGKILDEYALSDNMRVFHQENRGGTGAANRGLMEARGEYVTVLDSDDAFEPNLLKELVSVLEKNKDADFVYPDYYEVKRCVRSTISPKHLFETVAIGILFRLKKFKEVDLYRDGILFAEYDLLLRTIEKWKSIHCPTPLFTYYRRVGSATDDTDRVAGGIEELKQFHPNNLKEINTIRSYQ